MISTWFRKGLIPGYQAKPDSPFGSTLSEEACPAAPAATIPSRPICSPSARLPALGLSDADLRDIIQAGISFPSAFSMTIPGSGISNRSPNSPNPLHYDQ